jgi:hypothetical protein
MNTKDLSRRGLLQQAATAAGTVTVLGLVATPARSQAKLSLKDVEYQDQPKGTQRCDNCVQFEAPTACKVVDGKVSAQGWCKVYAPKPS